MVAPLVLDTSGVIGLVEHKNPKIRDLVAEAEEVVISRVTVAELWFGLSRATTADQRLVRERSLRRSRAFSIAESHASWPNGFDVERTFGALSVAAGRSISQFDRWIIAIAKEFAAALVTEDAKQSAAAVAFGVAAHLALP